MTVDANNSTPASPESVVAKLRQDRDGLARQMARMRAGWGGTLLFALLSIGLAGYIYYIETEGAPTLLPSLGILCGGAIAGILIRGMYNAYVEVFFGALIRNMDKQLAGERVEHLQETLEDDFFNKLVKINFKYIDQYYLQTQAQADKSFTLTVIVAVAGFLLLVSGVLLMYTSPEAVAPAYVASAAGVISEFIASVFFYLYNRTIVKMGEYHQKLVLTQNIGLALKITEELPPEHRCAAQRALIDRLSDNINHYLSLDQSATALPKTNTKAQPGQ